LFVHPLVKLDRNAQAVTHARPFTNGGERGPEELRAWLNSSSDELDQRIEEANPHLTPEAETMHPSLGRRG
jgi:hypothetical protein